MKAYSFYIVTAEKNEMIMFSVKAHFQFVQSSLTFRKSEHSELNFAKGDLADIKVALPALRHTVGEPGEI